jgi:hypothetical protein
MANCSVRFDFQTDLQGTLKYVHNIPRSLITPNAQATQRDPEYAKNFLAAGFWRKKEISKTASGKGRFNVKLQFDFRF